jgi:hypothetical protein
MNQQKLLDEELAWCEAHSFLYDSELHKQSVIENIKKRYEINDLKTKNTQMTELLADCINDLYGTAGSKFRKKTARKLMGYVHENNIVPEGVSR